MTARTVGANANEQANSDKQNTSETEPSSTQQTPGNAGSDDPADERSSCGEMPCNYCDDSGCCDSNATGGGCKQDHPDANACPKPGVPCAQGKEDAPQCKPGMPGCISLFLFTNAECSGQPQMQMYHKKLKTQPFNASKCNAEGNDESGGRLVKSTCFENKFSLLAECEKGCNASGCKTKFLNYPLNGKGGCKKMTVGPAEFIYVKFEGTCQGEDFPEPNNTLTQAATKKTPPSQPNVRA